MIKYVYVIFDPLIERVICVHDNPNYQCATCVKKYEEQRNAYHIKEIKQRLIRVPK